jgi:hypothetical protein
MSSMAEVVRRAPFPLYGLTRDWTGARHPNSAHMHNGEVTEVGLVHERMPGAPRLVVHTLLGVEGEPHFALLYAIQHLEGDLEVWAAIWDPDPLVDREMGLWRPSTLVVDGREQVFWLREEGERWAAFARVGQVRVVVTATAWDRGDVRLEVVDREDYAGAGGSTTSR